MHPVITDKKWTSEPPNRDGYYGIKYTSTDMSELVARYDASREIMLYYIYDNYGRWTADGLLKQYRGELKFTVEQIAESRRIVIW